MTPDELRAEINPAIRAELVRIKRDTGWTLSLHEAFLLGYRKALADAIAAQDLGESVVNTVAGPLHCADYGYRQLMDLDAIAAKAIGEGNTMPGEWGVK